MTRLFNVLILTLVLPLTALAQDYPKRTIRLVVPYAAGGGVDTVARAIAQELGASLHQAVIVDNRPGGNSVVGSEAVAHAAPDGYTLLVTLVSHYAMPFLQKAVPYDPVKDFTPITIVARAPQALVVNNSFPVKNVKELLEYARKHPGKVFFATSGAGTSQHLAGELLNSTAKIDMVHVPYKGGAPALNDVVAGQVPVAILIMSNVLPHAKAGTLRILAVVESKRAKSAPDVPTVAEAGVPGFSVPDTWIGIMGPKNLPAAIVSKLNAELVKVVERPEVRAHLEGAGFEVGVVQTADFARAGPAILETYRKLTADAKIEPE